jgi:flagella basal body P-ring formation protein FlgA
LFARTVVYIGTALVLWAAVASRAFGADVAQPAAAETRVRDAIVRALQHRMGPGVTFEITDITPAIAGPIDGPLAVTFDASARLGGRIRFLLSNKPRQPRARAVSVGEATAIVRASASAVRATRNLTHGVVVQDDDVEVRDGDLGAALVRRLPMLQEVVGARLVHDVHQDALIADTAVAGVPSVHSGDRVRVVAREPGVEVAFVAIAVDSGATRQIIHVVNPQTRRVLRARIVGRGEVEVTNER